MFSYIVSFVSMHRDSELEFTCPSAGFAEKFKSCAELGSGACPLPNGSTVCLPPATDGRQAFYGACPAFKSGKYK